MRTSPATPQMHARPVLVAVTGATGNIGKQIVSELLDKGYRVLGQFRNTIPSDPRAEWVRMDFADASLSDEVFERFVDGADAVIHLAASSARIVDMETANIVNLERLAAACAAKKVRYFGLASSMVVYGSPRDLLVTEDSPLIDPAQPIHKQYFADPVLQEYARTKRIGEDVLARFADRMHVDLYRISVAQGPEFLTGSLEWSWKRRLFALYRNSHFISSRNTAKAMIHLMESSLGRAHTGLEAYNICDRNSPTYAEFYRRAGRPARFHVPLVFDLLKNIKISRSVSKRRPMGWFRMDDSKLSATGFMIPAHPRHDWRDTD
jgi:nucleoside-diphosphate-sugar epimerase